MLIFESLALSLEVSEYSQASVVPNFHREKMWHMNFIPTDLEHDLSSLIYDEVDYVTYDEFFYEDYLIDLFHEMLYIEEACNDAFIESRIKRRPEDDDSDS